MRILPAILGAASVAAAMSAATVAHAEALGTLSPGVLYSYMGGASPAHGLGGELSFMHSPKNDFKAYGGFFQAQAYDFNGDDPHPRLALGAQAGSYFGAEAGVSWRGETATHSETFGTHLGIYGAIGVFALALRGTIPIVMPEVIGKQPHSWELGLSMALKLPIPLYGRLIAIR